VLRDFTTPEQFAVIRSQTVLRKLGQRNVYEIEIHRQNGEKRFLNLTATPYIDKSGQFVGAFVVIRDITEQKWIEQAEREQRTLAEALRDTANALSSSLDLEEVLELILVNVGRVVPHDAANIMITEGEWARVAKSRGYAERGMQVHMESVRFRTVETPNMQRMIQTGRPIIIPDIHNYPGWKETPVTGWIQSYAGAPIMTKDKLFGFISLDSAEPGFFNETHVEPLQAFANQAAIAIENAGLYKQAAERAQFVTQLNQITQSGLRMTCLNDLMPALAERLALLMSADGTYLTIWDEEKRLTIPAAAFGLNSEMYTQEPAQPGELTMTASVLDAARTIVVEDVFDSPYIESSVALTYPVRSVIGLPLIADEARLGAAIVGFRELHRFSAEELARGEQAAGQMALAIAKVRLLEAERQKTEELKRANKLITALSHVAARIETAREPLSVMRTLGEELHNLGIQSLVALLDQEDKRFKIRYTSLTYQALGISENDLGISTDVMRSSVEHSVYFSSLSESHQPFFMGRLLPGVVDLMLDNVAPQKRQMLCELAGVSSKTRALYLPLHSGEELIGMMAVWGDSLEEDDLPALSIFSSQVAVALENTRLYSEVRRLAITDDLTGLYNRRGIFELGQRELLRMRRVRRPLAVILLDLDGFKRINDDYGHEAGDQVIQAISSLCRSCVRAVDLAGRYGGEAGDEFVIVLPETCLPDAQFVAERMRQTMAETDILFDGGCERISASFGVAALTAELLDDHSLQDLIHIADQAMYQAKNTGKARVVVC
jgi:diguanylate cyclase (GGDEF)-like protein